MTLRVVGTWETQSLKNAQSFIVQSHLTKVLRLRGLKTLLHLQLCSRKKHCFYSFYKKRKRCVTLLGCRHLGDSESKECTAFFFAEPPYKSAEARRSQKVVGIATLKQKKALFLLFFTNKSSRCVTLLGCGHLGDSEYKECTVVCFTEPPYKSAEAPRSQIVVALATLKQKKALFPLFYKTKGPGV